MRPLCWLHISDIHMRISDAWSQDVVLTAMCSHIAAQGSQGVRPDFILLTGDVAFSGKAEEYALAQAFIEALVMASGVPRERIFCIPGNHDIDRDRQRLCFAGARALLQDQNRIDALLLGAGDDMRTLLERQERFRQFQKSCFAGQERTPTDDGLGYVARCEVENIRLAIVGLDSAWLSEGGLGDHGKLLVGECQTINALKVAMDGDDPPHVVVCMAHHPFHLLLEADRRPVQNRIEGACHFFHCGHLHEPDARTAGLSPAGCLTVAAGAAFESRQSQNTYSVVMLDLLGAKRSVTTIAYSPGKGAFDSASREEYGIEVMPVALCSVSELAQALVTYRSGLAPIGHYLSALLLDQKTEVPIPAAGGFTFGSVPLLMEQPDNVLKRKASEFMIFRNALRVLYKRISLSDILKDHGDAVVNYGEALIELCDGDAAVKTRLAEYEGDARMLASAEPASAFAHTMALLGGLAGEHEWELLRTQAERHVDSPDQAVATQARRMLALALAQSEEKGDRMQALDLYRSLAAKQDAEMTDLGNLAELLVEEAGIEEAKSIVKGGVERFPGHGDYFEEIGQRIVAATGDKKFRQEMEAVTGRKRKT